MCLVGYKRPDLCTCCTGTIDDCWLYDDEFLAHINALLIDLCLFQKYEQFDVRKKYAGVLSPRMNGVYCAIKSCCLYIPLT